MTNTDEWWVKFVHGDEDIGALRADHMSKAHLSLARHLFKEHGVTFTRQINHLDLITIHNAQHGVVNAFTDAQHPHGVVNASTEQDTVGSLDRNDLPYAWPEGMEPITYRPPTGILPRRHQELIRFPDALAAGPTLVSLSHKQGGHVFNGTLVLFQDRIAVLCEEGPVAGKWMGFAYEELAWFRIHRGLKLHKLTLQEAGDDGMKFHCRIGEHMAANARHVLTAKGVPSK